MSWPDVVSLLSADLTAADHADGWNADIRSRWLAVAKACASVGARFLPSDAAYLLNALHVDGITSGPVVDALTDATHRIPGVGTPAAVALAVKEVARGLRAFAFTGRTPHLQREQDGGTLQLVNLQRVNAGVTGREPGFTVNLNVVPGSLRRAWAATDHWRSRGPVRSGFDTGIACRLGSIAFGNDHWWHPSTADEGASAAREVLELMQSHGIPWLDRHTVPDAAIAALLYPCSGFREVEVAAAMLVERLDDPRRTDALRALRRWEPRIGGAEKPLLDWLAQQLHA